MPAPRLVRFEADFEHQELALGCPEACLRDRVASYCGYSERASAPASRLKVPSGTVSLIVSFGPTSKISYPLDGPRSVQQVGSFVVGPHDRPAVVESAAWQSGVQIDLTPLGAGALLGVPMHTLANRVVDFGEVVRSFWPNLAEELVALPDWRERFRWLDSMIARRLATARSPSPAVRWALQRLSETGGRLDIAAIAREVGSSRQYLFNRFREEVGLAPKVMARVVRFQNALQRLERAGPLRLTALAHECGYYDQAHFNREFREFTATTPTEFLARRLPHGGVAAEPSRAER